MAGIMWFMVMLLGGRKMAEMELSGSIDVLITSMGNIKAVINGRQLTGWSIGHESERWLYVTFPERAVTDVCPVCDELSQRVFSGDELTLMFPYHEYIGDSIILPRTHMPDLSKFANEPCHCEMHLLNLAESIEQRLHAEKMLVVV